MVRYAFKQQTRCAIDQRSINDIAVSGDPADISSTPVCIFIPDIKNPFVRLHYVNKVPGCRMEYTLGLSCTAAGVKNEERVFRIHNLWSAVVGNILCANLLIPPEIPSFTYMRFHTQSAHYNNVGDVGARLQRLISLFLALDDFAPPCVAVGANQ